MANNRSAIRTAIKALLVNQTVAGANVYTNRESNLWQSELPAIIISTGSEPVVAESLQSRRYLRTLELVLKIKIKATASVDDDLDTFVAQVEVIINGAPSLGGTVLTSIQTNTETRVDSEGETDIGVAELTFECKYIS